MIMLERFVRSLLSKFKDLKPIVFYFIHVKLDHSLLFRDCLVGR